MKFNDFALRPEILQAVTEAGYEIPTPIQEQAIPIMLTGADLLGIAQTGTGKTAAFVLPMIERLASGRAKARMPRSLILSPTRELATQTANYFGTYGKHVNLSMALLIGGVGMDEQWRLLERGVDVLIATPGRLLDQFERGKVLLGGVTILVIDEADRMLDMGFLPQLRRVLGALPRARQTLLLSATLSKDVVGLSSELTREPVRVDVSEAQVVAPTVTHRVHPVSDGRKGELLVHVLMQPPVGQALVFCKTKRGSNRVGQALVKAGVRAAVIHGNKSQGARNRALGDFKAGRVSVLVATDLAARGLDIAQLPLVVNYDLPLVAADYVHRVGRTGRAGLAGRAVSLVTPADRSLLHDIQRLLPSALDQVVVEGFEVVQSARAATLGPADPRHPRRQGPAFRPGARRQSRPAIGGAGRLTGSGRRPARP
jgi:ATP-dependent RNA helicase RhlE